MIKVKASMVLKPGEELPTDVEIDVPKEYCNRKEWNEFIRNVLTSMCRDRLKIEFTVVEDE